jgi:hypothetical protein
VCGIGEKNLKLDLVNYADDWQALYINGKLFRSDHSIRWDYDVLPELVGETIESFTQHPTWEDEDSYVAKHSEEVGDPPETLEELINYGK